VDFWVLRDGGGFTLVAEPEGRAAGHELFHRQLPPRLARVHDRTGQWSVVWLLGERAERVLAEAGLHCPAKGKTATEAVIPGPVIVARAEDNAPFQVVLVAPQVAIPSWRARLVTAGATEGGPDHLEAARILAGWPRLGFEITEKTLPQEVRYDAVGGVSYTKGCYVGQETVARVHFRGHPNRELRGLSWSGAVPANLGATTGGKDVGQVRSVLQLEERGFGLALLRREVADGEEVRLGATLARVEALPFG
jgi:folate-binding protein YgfZ